MNEVLLKVTLYQNIIMAVLISAFSAWNWYLCLLGKTTIEHMFKNKTEYKPFMRWRENLYVRFGSTNIAYILIPFIEKRSPLNGLEWEFVNQMGPNNEDTQRLIVEDV